jgi:uncharacterized membrane protein
LTHHDTSKPAREDLGLERVEAFSDAIFAFAATLLAQAIAVPSAEEVSSSRSLLRALQAALPSFVTFAVTFVVLGEAWVSHHRMLRMFRRADHALVWLNLLLLLVVAFSPFPTALLGRALGHDGAWVAVVLYGTTWAVGGLLFNAVWWRGKSALLRAEISAHEARRVTIRFMMSPTLYAVATILAPFAPWASLAMLVLLAILFMLPPPGRANTES